MSKKIISLALALIMCLALVPMTALAASTCEKIVNDYSSAATIAVGSKVEVGKKQIGTPPGDVTYYNVDYKYSFTLTDPSLVTVTLTTENPASSEQKPNYLGLKLICADEKTEIIPLDRSRSDNIEVHSGEDRLSDNMSYKLLPGKYYLWVDSRTSNNAYGWVQINSVTATQEDFGGEPNDTTLLAQAKSSIGTGVDYKGNISYEGNKEGKDNYNRDRWDYYRFDVPSDGYGVKLTVSRADTTVVNNLEAYLCDVNANSIKPTISLKDTPTGSVEYKNLKKGTYFVLIDGSPTTALETEYTFRLDPLDGSAATQPPTTQPPTTQPPAADKPSSWAVEQVDKAIAEKLVPQSLQSKYTQATTRAEFCALAVALYENIKGTITGRTTFTDTTDVNVEKAASIGVVSGVGNNKFDPDAKLTREQAAVMLSRLAEAVGKPFEKKAATFADNGKMSSWALEGVGQVQAAGIMGGVGNNTFAPKDPYTREQSIITILRTYDAVKGGGTTEPKPTTTSVSLDKTVYEPGKPVYITVSNVTEQMANDFARAFIFKVGADHNANVEDYHIQNLEKGTNTFSLPAPYTNGEYEVRVYKARNPSAANLVTSASFTVGQATQTPIQDNGIIGKWTSSSYGAWVDGNPNNYPGSGKWMENRPENSSSSSYLSCWEFKEDGTFWNFSYVPGMYGLEGPSWVYGKYRIDGDTIYCTNRTETKWYDETPSKNYTNKSVSDVTFTIRFDDNGELIMSSSRYIRVN